MTSLLGEPCSKPAQSTALIAPYWGQLVDLLVPIDEIDEAKAYANILPSLRISERSVCDLALLATVGFSPLDRFMRSVESLPRRS
jgi:ATP sulfurylase